MRIFLIAISSFWMAACLNAQVIKGTITCNNEPVENAILMLKLSSGDMQELKTDKNGKYQFDLTDTVSDFIISATTDASTRINSQRVCILASRDEGKGTLEARKHYIKDFVLTKVECGGRFPAILFYKNSILSCNDSLFKTNPQIYSTFDEACAMFVSTLKDNPTIIIEIQGHASSNEKNPEDLSLFRAQLFREILIAKGINRKRIEVKSWGKKKLLVKDEIIAKAKSAEEKEALHSKNRRVVFRILNWDFKE